MSSSKFRIHPHWSWSDTVHRCTDTVVIALGLVVAQWWGAAERSDHALAAGAACVVIYYLIAEMTGLYRSWRGVATERELSCTLVTWVTTLPAAMVVGFAFGYESQMSRMVAFIWFSVTAVALIVVRLAIRIVALHSEGQRCQHAEICGCRRE